MKPDQLPARSQLRRRFRILERICRNKAPYSRMEEDIIAKKQKAAEKENKAPHKETKEKKSKKGAWKRLRRAALTTCRYLGMGAAHLSPASTYCHPDYYADPKYWNRSFSNSYRPKKGQPPPNPTPHWTSHMMFAGW